MRRRSLGLAFLLTVAIIVPLTAGPASADATTVSVSSPSVVGSTISVSGTVTYGTDATDNLVLGTDPTGDAVGSVPGMDLTGLSVRPNIAGRQLIWTLTTANGLPDPVGGPAPAVMGYQVPFTVDGQDFWRWLGAGTAGAGNPPQTGKWTALCHNELANGAQGGWSCPGAVFTNAGTYLLPGSITASGVTWTQAFAQMKPQIQYGSVLEQGSILCGRPCSYAWPPGLVGTAAPVDTIDVMDSYKVPGEVTLGIAAVGVPPTPAIFTTPATFNGTTGGFTGSMPVPGTPGAYTVWARTCFGLADSLNCIVGGADITV